MGLFKNIKNLFKRSTTKELIKTNIKRSFSNIFGYWNKIELATNETIFAAISIKANAIASAPITLQKNYVRLKPSENKVAKLLKYGPNPRQSTFDFITQLEVQRNTTGVGYALIIPDQYGDATAMYVMDSTLVEPIIEKDTKELYYGVTFPETGTIKYIHNSLIVDVKHISSDGLHPVSPLDLLKNTINWDSKIKELSLEQLQASLKANVQLKLDSKLSPEMIDEFMDMFWEMQEEGILVTDSGKELKELSQKSFVDPQLLTSEQITIERVERVFNIVGKLTKGSAMNKTTTADAEDLLYLKDSILPVIRLYEQAFNKKLLKEHERDQGYEIKFNMQGYARANLEKRGNFYQQAIRNGWMNLDEIRALEDYPPIPGGYGEQFYVSRDLLPIEQSKDLLALTNSMEGGEKFENRMHTEK